TPGYASVPGAWHTSADSSSATPRIPVIPISYGIANEILSRLHGRDIPNIGWQGGLAFRYHIAASASEPVRATMSVEDDRNEQGGLKQIWDVVGTVPGTTFPDEWVIVGGHRDAWCYGAEDNVSGCASVVAAAEAFAKLAKEGIRPKRSVLFVTWDAEEWGLLGSTEWVEQLEKELGTKAIAYINQDECATGSSFEASADPSLRTFVYDVAKAVPDGTGNPIYADWSRRAAPKVSGIDPIPTIGLLGGGSDFSPFYNHLGIPSLEHGFGGSFGEYHSNHDNIAWTLHFGDSTFRSHAATSQFAAVEAMRLANADILPLDFAAMGIWLRDAAQHEKSAAGSAGYDSAMFAPLLNAAQKFTQDGNEFDSIRNRAIEQTERSFTEVNQMLRDVERSFTKSDGLFFDKWERNMLVLADPDNGYADVRLPELNLSVRRKNRERLQSAVQDLTEATQAACAKLEEATQKLQ
ncbi:MAG TPA: M20/M25/M40 family metallo-hydrolase, partial [Candidatus Kapabacteria bacterium]